MLASGLLLHCRERGEYWGQACVGKLKEGAVDRADWR